MASNTKALIFGMLVAAIVVVASIVGYFEYRRSADGATARDQVKYEVDAANRATYRRFAVDALADILAKPTTAPFFENRLAEAIDDLQVPASSQKLEREFLAKDATARYEEKYPEVVKQRARDERDERIRQYEASLKNPTP